MKRFIAVTPLECFFYLIGGNEVNNKMLIHIPHSSMYIPDEYVEYFCADSETILRNLIALSDYATDNLFCHPRYQNRLVFPISRLLCDVERYRSDNDEIMSKQGMGVVYTHGAYCEPLRSYNETLRAEILRRYYDPHHEALLQRVTAAIDEFGYCIIVDAHSFPSKPLPYELDQSPYRADFCIGTDKIHTPAALSKEICNCITEMGYTFELNKPYGGTIVPLPLYGSGASVISVMIEINRRLYMDESKQSLSPQFDETKKTVLNILDVIAGWISKEQNTIPYSLV